MEFAKFLFVVSTVYFIQVQGQNWPSKCQERPVLKNFDAKRVIENENFCQKRAKTIFIISVCRQVVRCLPLRRRLFFWLQMCQYEF